MLLQTFFEKAGLNLMMFFLQFFDDLHLNPCIHSECGEIQAKPIPNVNPFHTYTKLFE